MFRGRLAPLSRFGLQSRGLTSTASSAGVGHLLGGGIASPRHYSMFKTPERKEFPSRQGGILADNRPTLFDGRNGQIFQPETNISTKTAPSCGRSLMIYLNYSADLLRSIRPRRGGRAAECGGLLNLPALFALADFHLFSVIHAALSCAATSTFAGYSAPRVHQEFVIAILPRTGTIEEEAPVPYKVNFVVLNGSTGVLACGYRRIQVVGDLGSQMMPILQTDVRTEELLARCGRCSPPG